MDDLRTALAELAPDVDTRAALDVFRADLRRIRRRRRIGAALALAALVGFAALAMGASRHEGKAEVLAGAGDEVPAVTPTSVHSPEQDVDAIRSAFLAWIEATPKDDVDAYVEDYASIRSALEAGIAQHTPEDLSKYSGRVDTISLIDSTHADVTYTIVHDGTPQYSERPGRAIKVAGAWKVSRDTVCDLLTLGGITCPP